MQTPANESSAEFSPDGRWIAYMSDESGRNQVYVRAFPDSGGKWQISNDGGNFPRWSRDGRELVYRTLCSRMMSVAVKPLTGPTFQYDDPRELFPGSSAVRGDTSTYDFAPDGKRFVMIHEAHLRRGRSHTP